MPLVVLPPEEVLLVSMIEPACSTAFKNLAFSRTLSGVLGAKGLTAADLAYQG